MKNERHRSWVARIAVFFAFVFAGCFTFFAAEAGELIDQEQLFLDEQTAERGYTVSVFDDDFQVGVLPGSLHGASRVKLSLFEEGDLPSLSGWKRVTPIAESLLDNTDTFPEVQPYSALRYEEGVDPSAVRLAYADKLADTWRFLPSDVVPEQRLVRARLPFRTVTVAGFIPDPSSAPVRVSDTPAPGGSAQAVLVMDVASDTVLHAHNIHETLPLASLTKLISATAALDLGTDLSSSSTYTNADSAEGARVRFSEGDLLSHDDVLHASLMASGNNAANWFARTSGQPTSSVIGHMNTLADDLGLSTPSFVEPTGLDSRNVASAYDFGILAQQAFSHPAISRAASTASYTIQPQNRDVSIPVSHTNWWLQENDVYVLGSKTGYLPESWGGIGFSLVVQARSSATSRDDVLVLVMGAPNRTSSIEHVDALYDWVFETFSWGS